LRIILFVFIDDTFLGINELYLDFKGSLWCFEMIISMKVLFFKKKDKQEDAIFLGTSTEIERL
jgi:hypothetical protein